MITQPIRSHNNGSYAEEFKPAVVLGNPTLDTMSNRTYLGEQKESFDEKGGTRLHQAPDVTDPSLNTIFRLDTVDPTLSPAIRKVTVSGKTAFDSFLVEMVPGDKGICVVMLQEKGTQAYCNIRFLPVSTANDIITGIGSSGAVQVKIPKTNVVKLNVTLEASSTGEVLYNTHKTEVNLEDSTSSETLELKRQLEFKAAELAAHYCGQLIVTVPESDAWHTGAVTGQYNVQFANGLSNFINNHKKVILTCTAIATGVGVVVGGVGIVAGLPGVALCGAILAAIGGGGRNAVALASPTPAVVGKKYRCLAADTADGGGDEVYISIQSLA